MFHYFVQARKLEIQLQEASSYSPRQQKNPQKAIQRSIGPSQVQSARPRGQSHFKGGTAGNCGPEYRLPSATSHHGPPSTHHSATLYRGDVATLVGLEGRTLSQRGLILRLKV